VSGHLDRDEVRDGFLPHLRQYIQAKDSKATINGKSDVKLRCPQCETKKGPPRSVKLESGLFLCHHCGYKGDLFDLIQGYENLDFPGARWRAYFNPVTASDAVVNERRLSGVHRHLDGHPRRQDGKCVDPQPFTGGHVVPCVCHATTPARQAKTGMEPA